MPIKTERTLIIGLGGTGKEILLRIRRRFFLAGCPTQPWVSYLWIDTAASQPAEWYARGLPRDYVSNVTKFDADEIYDLGVSAQQAFDIQKNPLSWMNVWEWAEPEAIQPALQGQGLENGAKQQPPLGRLALFFHGPKLLSKLAERIEQLQDSKITKKKEDFPAEWNFDVNSGAPLKIIIVGSLAGGTGAGCCVDVAGMLRAGGQNLVTPLAGFQSALQEAKIYGFFVLPEAFCGDPESRTWAHFDQNRVRANGYAMMQELENVSLVRGDGGQFLTGRDKIGQLHCTWMYPTDLKRAPWVSGPLYHNIFVFDGHGEIDTKLGGIGDSYDLVSNMLFYEMQGKNKAIESARSNESYQSSRGHIEMVPPEANDFREAVWSNVYSFAFGTAGNAQVTFDAPRLRLNTAYTLAERALRDWLGEPNADPKATEAERDLHDKRMELLKKNLLTRLETELISKDAPTGTRWSEIVRGRTAFQTEARVNATRWRPPVGFRMKGLMDALITEKLPFQPTQFARDLETDFLTNRRLDQLLHDVVDTKPLPTAVGTDVYSAQGGVRAAELLVGSISEPGQINERIKEFQASMRRVAATKDAAMRSLQAAIEKKITDLDRHLANLEEIETDKTWFNGSARKAREDAINAEFGEVIRDMQVYAKLKYDKGLNECMEKGWEQFLAGTLYADFARQWQGWLAQTRQFLDDLLTRPADERRSDPGNGIADVLKGLRSPSTNTLTKILRPELHTDSRALWAKINELYKARGALVEDHVQRIQKRAVEVWRAELKKLHDMGKLAREPRDYTHIVDLANDEAIPREGERYDPAPDKLGFSARLDALYLLVSKVTLANQMLTTGESVLRELTEADREFLRKYSHCRLSVYRKANGEIERRDDLIARDTGVLEPPKEHKHFHAPAGTERLSGFSPEVESDPLEARAFRVELSVPLPAMRALKPGADAAAGIDQFKLHFFRPKNGYMAIHKFEESDARKNRNLYKHAVLAIMLGQFRPNPEREGQDDWCFEWLVDSTGRAQPNQYLRSIADVVRYLGRPDNQNFTQAIMERNEGLLLDLSPNVLLALDLITQYNISWAGRQQLKFSRIKEQLQKQNADIEESYFEPPSVQKLVLDAIRETLAETLLERWNIRLELDPNKPQGNEVQMTFNLLQHFIHHFAMFIPAVLRKTDNDQTRARIYPVALLALLSEVDQSSHLEGDEDLTLREPHKPGQRLNPISGKLGLRAPWQMYTPDLAGRTFEQHYYTAHTRDVSMQPVKRDEGMKVPPYSLAQIAKDERLNDGAEWNAQLLYADVPVLDEKLYRAIFKMKTLAGNDPALCKAFTLRRKELAGHPYLHTSGGPAKGLVALGTAPVAPSGQKAIVTPSDVRTVPIAVSPATPPPASLTFVGRFVNVRAILELVSGSGDYTGELELLNPSRKFSLRAREHGGKLAGQFSKGASSWAFEAEFRGNTLEFKTGKTVEILEREQESNPFDAEEPNPFDAVNG
ncbi:MAG: tubulin-like doman-containing protein [Planctomycetota bacterium]